MYLYTRIVAKSFPHGLHCSMGLNGLGEAWPHIFHSSMLTHMYIHVYVIYIMYIYIYMCVCVRVLSAHISYIYDHILCLDSLSWYSTCPSNIDSTNIMASTKHGLQQVPWCSMMFSFFLIAYELNHQEWWFVLVCIGLFFICLNKCEPWENKSWILSWLINRPPIAPQCSVFAKEFIWAHPICVLVFDVLYCKQIDLNIV